MSDIRFEPISGYWVTIAPNRNDRPTEFVPTERVVKRLICPFCAGNESETPATLVSYDSSGSQVSTEESWLVRVVPNKYPSFSVVGGNNGIPSAANGQAPGNGLYESLSAHGVQELIIPTSRHLSSLSQLTSEESKVALIACRDRVVAADQQGLAHAMLFTNCRSSAGASLEHIHTQLIASPIQSDTVSQRVARNRDYFDKNDQCLIHALTEWELKQEDRVVEKTEHFSLICPYASRFAFQSWIVPNEQVPSFQKCSDSVIGELAQLVQQQIMRLESLLDEPAYNVLFHLPPFSDTETEPWFVEIFPRLTKAAGFELGTDIWVNPIAPELAARRFVQVEL